MENYMKAAIYNPYLNTLGGGERYTMAIAQVLAKVGYAVDIEWKDSSIRKKLEERFGINLQGINFISNIKKGDGYDICFWVSDGSIPLLRARCNLLHFQVPFHDVDGRTLLNRMKLFRINKIICNSNFTKKIIDKEYGIKSVVIYPPVAVDKIKAKRKENIILAVGRFSQLKQVKGHTVLIQAFKEIFGSGLKDWKLVLAGGAEVGAKEYLENLEQSAKCYPIEIIKSPDFKTLKNLYGKSKIFWSAAGFGVDENKEPEKVEHFGITVVEAMAAASAPIVYRAGGYREIITDGIDGFFFVTSSELVELTENLIKNPGLRRKIAGQSKITAVKFSYDNFEKSLLELLKLKLAGNIS